MAAAERARRGRRQWRRQSAQPRAIDARLERLASIEFGERWRGRSAQRLINLDRLRDPTSKRADRCDMSSCHSMLLVVVAVVATSQATDGRLWKKRNQKSGVDAWREHNRTALGRLEQIDAWLAGGAAPDAWRVRGPRDLAGEGVPLAKSIQKEVNASSIVRERDGRRVPVVVKALRKARQFAFGHRDSDIAVGHVARPDLDPPRVLG